jgi:ribosomal protein S18 acetylase RimI-like enzyme
MIAIRPLTQLDPADLARLMTGYTSPARYRVDKAESAERFTLALELEPLTQPYVKRWDPPDAETLARYQALPALGCCYGAYEGVLCVGLALAEPIPWNRTLWVWELHVAASHHRQGIGRRLVAALAEAARIVGQRAVVCETQSTNVPAIRFYRAVGFAIEGVDVSYYSNADWPEGEVAVFMKRRVG